MLAKVPSLEQWLVYGTQEADKSFIPGTSLTTLPTPASLYDFGVSPGAASVSTRQRQMLQKVNLPLIEKISSLDAVAEWSQVLSGGEQQRLAFARLLLMPPQYAVLDEATSSLDLKNERLLYRQMQKRSVTFISVGHRSTLVEYHQQVLELFDNQTWQLIPAER